jgi:hypothetical protein
MRRTVRPFVKEFKTRWSKSSKSPAQTEAECDTPRFTQSFLELDVASQPGNRDDDGYLAALKAADAAFGGLSQVIREGAAVSHVGRVLPSLVEEVPPPLVRAPEAKKKAATGRKVRMTSVVRKAESPAPSTAKKRAAPAKAPFAKVQGMSPSVDPESQADALEPRFDPATRREGRSIQKRWVIKAELKPGEKWKRRLRKPAW